jgi:hypothetical protein
MDWTQIGQLIINSFLVLVTLGLVIVTSIYAFSTHNMAKEMKQQSAIMQREFELRIAPLIEPKISLRITGVINPVIQVSAVNKGFYPVKFEYIYFRWWHREKPENNDTGLIEIGKWLEKGESAIRDIKIEFSKIALFKDASDVNENGMVSVELHFVDLEKKQITLNKDKIIIFGLQPTIPPTRIISFRD